MAMKAAARSGLLNRRFSVCFLLVFLAGSMGDLAASSAAGPPAHPPGAAAEGRRLLREGKPAEAEPKLKDAWSATREPEILFDLAVCYERLGKKADASAAFRTYLRLPLALRLSAAEEHLRALEPTTATAPDAGTWIPRRVLMPSGADAARCFEACTHPSCSRHDRLKCAATQFRCLTTCPGARVELGLCMTTLLRAGERCRTETGAL